MRIDIITVVPELLESPLSHSIVGRAIKKGLVEINVHNLREYGKGPRQQVDDYSYGGDAGMVMMVEPIYRMIEQLKSEREYSRALPLTYSDNAPRLPAIIQSPCNINEDSSAAENCFPNRVARNPEYL